MLLVAVSLAALSPVAAHSPPPALFESVFAVCALAAAVRLPVAILGYLAGEAAIFAVCGVGILLGLRGDWPVVLLQPATLAALALGVAVRASRAGREAIEQLVALREERAAADVRLAVETDLPEDPALRTTVHRIVQESLTNALRHAQGATWVEVRISRERELIAVSVVDNGRPAPRRRSPGAGVGLRAMRERAEAFGGEVEAGPVPTSEGSPDGGWRTRASFPCGEAVS
ncbi:sensor histidine kinase [Microbacterium sp. gxy059]|uniref:sensor histidine kinase n=1 Tax=Microbacterium sp. gxy059 TaxID=2957199 RepID=UPI003D97F193